MTDKPVDLDKHRAAADQKAAEFRRQRREQSNSDEEAHAQHQAELDALLLADPAETWPQAAARARFLIKLFAETQEAQDPRYAELIAYALDDLNRLVDKETENK